MRTIRVKIADLFAFDDKPPSLQTPDVTSIIPWVLKQFGFLPQPLAVTIEGDEVVLQFPEESDVAQSEAARLAEKAAKRAAEGNYIKAIGIFRRVLELQPSLHSARRDLAMAYMEIGDVENATNHLMEVLLLDSGDAWSWVVLGNLYIREKSDLQTGEDFLRRALHIKPDDAWALSSLAVVCQKRGKTEEAISLFEKAILANPDFANPYYAEAVLFEATQQPQKALSLLNKLFARAKMQDARSQPVFDNARQLFAKVQADLASQSQSEAFRCVQNYKGEMETLSGFPIRIEEREFEDKVGARIQMAWKHGRDYHLISTRRGYSPELLAHLEAHELTHLKLESEARKVGKNLFFATTAKTRETAIRSVSGDLLKWQKESEFADLTGLREWYEWKPDVEDPEAITADRQERTTNPELLREKHPAAVWYLLSALERYDSLPVEKIREIAFEIATLGQNGLNYADPETKYTLRSIPGKKFSGLQLMCPMYAGFNRIAPELDPGLDLHEPFLTALELFQQRTQGG